MALTREKKEEIVEDLKKIFASATSAVFVNFHGLSVGDSNAMRGLLCDARVMYKVGKKSLIKRALDASSIKGERIPLPGEIAIAYGDDPIAPAREVYEASKKYKDCISIEGGIYEGSFRTRDDMRAIALIPPLPVLRGQFVNLINSPIQGFVMALGQIAKKKQ